MEIVVCGFPQRMTGESVATLKNTIRRVAMEVRRRNRLDWEMPDVSVSQEMPCIHSKTKTAIIDKKLLVIILAGSRELSTGFQDLATDIKEALQGRFPSLEVKCRVITSVYEA